MRQIIELASIVLLAVSFNILGVLLFLCELLQLQLGLLCCSKVVEAGYLLEKC